MLLFLTAFLLSFIEYALIKRAVSKLTVIVPDRDVDCGRELEIRYETSGIHVLPGCILSVCIGFSWHKRVLEGLSVYSSRSRHGLISLQAQWRGEYRSPGAFFQVNDAAGFFRFRAFNGREEQLIVNPELIDDFDMPRIMTIGGKDQSRTTRKKRSDELIETRQYCPGDDIRRINWKTFAHLGELFIRQGEELPDPDSRLTIIPDLSGVSAMAVDSRMLDNYPDYLVSVLTGIIEALGRAGVSLDILLPDGSTAGGSRSDFLPGMWWNEGPPDLQFAGSRRSSYLLVSSPFSNRASKVCQHIVKAGRFVSVVVPLPPVPPPVEPRGRLEKIIFTGPKSEENAFGDIYRTEAKALIARIKALGGGVNADII